MNKKIPLLFCDNRESGDTVNRQAQLVEVHLLRVFDKICRDNGLQYWLAYGTLIGALRHNGFIPWDDDTDVWMPKDDFLKFEKIVKSQIPDDVYVENRKKNHRLENLVLHLRDAYSFALLRTSKRILLNDHHGICLDIFMLESCSGNTSVTRLIRRLHDGFIWRSLRAGYGPVSMMGLFKKWGSFAGRLIMGVVWKMHQLVFRENDWLIRTGGGGALDEWFKASDFYGDSLDQVREHEFEGYKYFVPVKSEIVLKRYYGEWQQLPRESAKIPCYEYKMPMQPCFHPMALDYRVLKETGSVEHARKHRPYQGRAKIEWS